MLAISRRAERTRRIRRLWLGGRQEIASRVAFILANGPLDDGQIVRHTCDNVECCNPLHLIAGVQADNIADKVARRRQATGERVGTSRLTEDQVAEIRRRHTGRRGGQRLLAHEFGVSETVISGIVRGQSWRAVA